MGTLTKPLESVECDPRALSQSLDSRWREVSARWLPLSPVQSIWRYSRASERDDPEQGWKLHVSANLLTACDVLERIGPFLAQRRVLFKCPRSLEEVRKINCGLFYNYSQVGKVFTVYPRCSGEALSLAKSLHAKTLGLRAPAVPYDLRFREGSSVHYRYGAFAPLELVEPDGTRTPAIRDPKGDLVPDSRDVAMPDWVSDLLQKRPAGDCSRSNQNMLRTSFRAFQAISRRGKGGVYLALDVNANPLRLCVLKEGREGGEIEWDSRDGRWRIRNEYTVLKQLRVSGLNVPEVYDSFEVEGNCYVAMELIDGENLQSILERRQRRLSVTEVLNYAVQLAAIVSKVHSAGWVWRDCKPANFMVTAGNELRPVDFEGACAIGCDDRSAWSTWEFAPPAWRPGELANSKEPGDFYAIGSVVYFLLTGRVPEKPNPIPISTLRRGVSSLVSDLVHALLSPDPSLRPDARTATRKFMSALACMKRRSS